MGDGDANLANLTEGEGRIGVVAGLRGQIECHGEAGLSLLKQVLVAAVGLLGGGETGVLAHGPESATVHGGLDAAGEGKARGVANLAGVLRACNIALVIERLDLDFRGGLESLLPLLVAGDGGAVDLFQPIVLGHV